ncbi:hypothetical protein [Microbispora bryophytorum]|uniref:Uncharacterized protein n=1 Tax=Microbispora bryophytorum subsp. camponoti TaxID=1677852 RepID=A0ABR8KYQ8_9ACTN|nr:hypothetical protein [Microbispora camponoti]MBD3142812.1 hypothetical protein [Microbispora camponoti]
MHNLRLAGASATLALASTFVAVSAFAPAHSGVRAAARAAVLEPDPPEDKPCPNGEPKPCGASGQDREGVDSGREDARKEAEAAKKDIAAARDKTDQCPPGSAQGKQCMQNLIGDGAEQQAGMDNVRQELDTFQPAPADNATSALNATCDAFAAGLPAAFKVSDGSPSLTSLCESMNK